ncbi:uncharacterized protein LAESUDRAFT_811149 [Laetiporus sulphureus 93-53]|uniref:Uncharacterized protein n=1 Tax=Laetiporus sulphureus 93-53 TaxID=1314785 RepID=A0A165F7B3_9APHY|nr:uncharacterized protein LAESUDRAFT_811149 [Laetiporus sulphureus 93-53]KZT08527.1 hypothetical protein LAESUDRAFT_811149 [Laetiporus sulphureus 93-53]
MAKPAKFSAPAPSPRSLPRVSRQHQPSPRRQPASLPSPSSSLLALFATVAASASTVDGHPLPTRSPPPDFLCPQFGCAAATPSPAPARDVDESSQGASSSATAASSSIRAQYARSVSVADKYVSYSDGRWRKTDVWTLYGSTFCSDGICSATPTATTTIVETMSASVTSTATGVIGTNAADNVSEDIDTLPSGWTKESHTDPYTPVIITLSVVLAIMICVTIISCVFWRRRAKRLKDPERRTRRADGAVDDDTREWKRFRSQQRLWARATARWKANVRQSARRRKKQTASRDADPRLSTESLTRDSSSSLRRSHAESISSARSGAASSGVSLQESNYATQRSTFTDSAYPRRPTPPAYPSNDVDVSIERGALSHQVSSLELSFGRNAPPALPFNSSASASAGPVDGPLPYEGSPHAGHLATDDKAVLAHMASLASAPPSADPSAADALPDSSALYASVPPLDDEFEPLPRCLQVVDCDANVDVQASGSRRSLLPMPPHPGAACPPSPHNILYIPPPPEKARLVAPTFYEYPVSFEEDVLGVEPEAGPSAPPFEETQCPAASAPPLELGYGTEDVGVQPSAPPADSEPDAVRITGMDVAGSSGGVGAPPSSVEQSLSLHRVASHHLSEHASIWHTSPPRYLP